MNDWILSHEPEVRFGAFASVFVAVALWELTAARRPLRAPKIKRWLANLAIVAVNTAILRLLVAAAAVGMAWTARERGWGLLNNIDLAHWGEVVGAIVLMDVAIYGQHVCFHRIGLLWRLHRVHHADVDLDVTTGIRFHPLEIVLSMVIKCALVLALGPAPVAVVIFEVLLNATSMFNHANGRLPERVDRVLRWFIVTPDMHRVHHSAELCEANRNFGFNLALWDRLFATYQSQPSAGHLQMQLGLADVAASRSHSLLSMLALPFLPRRGHASNTASPEAQQDQTAPH